MKKLFSIFVVIVFFISACEKVDYIEPNFDPIDGQGLVTIKVAHKGGEASEFYGRGGQQEMFMLESNKQFIFSYQTELEVDFVIWEFWDESQSFENNPIYFYGGYDIKSITLTVVTTDGQSYQVTSYLNLFPRWPKTPLNIKVLEPANNGNYVISAEIYKNAWHGVSGNFNFIGSVTEDPWEDYQLISPADTNYRMAANDIMHPADGMGHWLKTQIEIQPGDHSFGVVRFDGEDPIWGNFKNSEFVLESEPTLISFHLTENGQIISANPLPGEGGDMGPSAPLRYTINTNTITVFVNLVDNFTEGNPWWSYLDHNEEWHSAIYLSAVENFPTWGKFTIPISELPKRLVWGLHSGQTNSNMFQSQLWDSYYEYCYLHLIL